MKKQRVIYHEGISHEQEDPSKPAIYVDNRRTSVGNPAKSIPVSSRQINYPAHQRHVQRRFRRVDTFHQLPGESYDNYINRRWQTRFLD